MIKPRLKRGKKRKRASASWPATAPPAVTQPLEELGFYNPRTEKLASIRKPSVHVWAKELNPRMWSALCWSVAV